MDLPTKIHRLTKLQARHQSSSSDTANAKAKIKTGGNTCQSTQSGSITKKKFNLWTFLWHSAPDSVRTKVADIRSRFYFLRSSFSSRRRSFSETTYFSHTSRSNLINMTKTRKHQALLRLLIFSPIFGLCIAFASNISAIVTAHRSEPNEQTSENEENSSGTDYSSSTNPGHNLLGASDSQVVPSTSNTRPPSSYGYGSVPRSVLASPLQNQPITSNSTQINLNASGQSRIPHANSMLGSTNANSEASGSLVVNIKKKSEDVENVVAVENHQIINVETSYGPLPVRIDVGDDVAGHLKYFGELVGHWRKRLVLSQEEFRMLLLDLYNVKLSPPIITGFEQNSMSFSRMKKWKPKLEKFLDAIDDGILNLEPIHGKRKLLVTDCIAFEKIFRINPKPTEEEIQEIAASRYIEKEIVDAWFSNRRSN